MSAFIRVWAVPFALANNAILGWLIAWLSILAFLLARGVLQALRYPSLMREAFG